MAANQASKPVSGTETVVVACKLPHGMTLRIFEPAKQMIPVPGGGVKEEQIFAPLEEVFTVNGNAHEQNKAPHCMINEGGYALTRGIPKHFWDVWAEQNKKAPYFVNKFIFAYESGTKVEGESKENASRMTGLERVDPANIKARLGGGTKIETATR